MTSTDSAAGNQPGTEGGTAVEPALEATARTLGEEAEARWEELDLACRVPDDLGKAAMVAGLFRTLVPTGMGGGGATPLEWFRAGVELARHEASYAWVVTQGAVELGWIAAGADPAWAAEVLADPLGTSASTVAGLGALDLDATRPTFGGRWAFDTGVDLATWVGGLALVTGRTTPDGAPVLRWGWVPADRAEVLDDWDPSGLRGTGSRSIVIPEQEVDPAWTFSPFDVTANDRGAHRALVGNGNWPIAASVAAVQLGAARRAIDEARAAVATKAPPPTFQPLARNAAVQRAVVRAEGRWHAALRSVEHELAAMWDEAGRVGELSRARRVSLFGANLTASETAVGIVEAMCEVTGTLSVDRSHPLARVRRDVQALAGHIAVNGTTSELAAQVDLGLLESDIRV